MQNLEKLSNEDLVNKIVSQVSNYQVMLQIHDDIKSIASWGKVIEYKQELLRRLNMLDKLSAKVKWQPIEITLKKEGHKILGLTNNDYVEPMVYREEIDKEFFYSKAGWWGTEGDTTCNPNGDQPTHFMPLPEPPKESIQESDISFSDISGGGLG